jgi:hypothetical protein
MAAFGALEGGDFSKCQKACRVIGFAERARNK